jgi:hypothetical protein
VFAPACAASGPVQRMLGRPRVPSHSANAAVFAHLVVSPLAYRKSHRLGIQQLNEFGTLFPAHEHSRCIAASKNLASGWLEPMAKSDVQTRACASFRVSPQSGHVLTPNRTIAIAALCPNAPTHLPLALPRFRPSTCLVGRRSGAAEVRHLRALIDQSIPQNIIPNRNMKTQNASAPNTVARPAMP